MTLTLNRSWSNIGTTHRFSILDICAKLFVNPTSDSKDIEQTQKHDGQTEGRTDRTHGLTDNGAKNNMSPPLQYVSPFHGGDIMIMKNISTQIQHLNITPFNYHIDRNNRM